MTLKWHMLRTPDGEANIELVKFDMPLDEKGVQRTLAHTLGIRHIAFAVEDIEAVVAKLKKKGAELVGEIQNYENAYKLCYVRGLEGIILELAEQIKQIRCNLHQSKSIIYVLRIMSNIWMYR